MRIIFFFSCLFFITFRLLAADAQEEQMKKQLEEIMRTRNEILKSLMDDSNFEDMSKRMEKLMQNFSDNDFFRQGMMDSNIVGEYDWQETKTHLILSLKVKQIKDHPLDIKINKGQIIIKGDVESQSGDKNNKKISKVHFERVFSIPKGVDESNPEFENKNGEFFIKFKKTISSHPPPNTIPKKGLEPVAPSAEDQKI